MRIAFLTLALLALPLSAAYADHDVRQAPEPAAAQAGGYTPPQENRATQTSTTSSSTQRIGVAVDGPFEYHIDKPVPGNQSGDGINAPHYND